MLTRKQANKLRGLIQGALQGQEDLIIAQEMAGRSDPDEWFTEQEEYRLLRDNLFNYIRELTEEKK